MKEVEQKSKNMIFTSEDLAKFYEQYSCLKENDHLVGEGEFFKD